MTQHEIDVLKIELSEMTDRQLQEKIALQLATGNSIRKNIYDNVKFFFWVTLISAALMFIGYKEIEHVLKHMN
jgi:hypothetical protein